MKYIWKLVEDIKDEHRQKTIFLAVNACVWGLLAFLIFIPISLLVSTPDGAIALALYGAGYGSILVGIYGGIFYLYRKE